MIPHLNPWIGQALGRAEKIFEDSDRKSRAAALFTATLRRVHRLATNSAIRCGAPTLDRHQVDQESPVLLLEWYEDGWHLYFAVRRGFNVRPYITFDFFGDVGMGSRISRDPTDPEITQVLHDYFEAWKRGENNTR